MHPNEPRLFWAAATAARELNGQEGEENIRCAVEELTHFALHAAKRVADRAVDALEALARSGPSPLIRLAAYEALDELR